MHPLPFLSLLLTTLFLLPKSTPLPHHHHHHHHPRATADLHALQSLFQPPRATEFFEVTHPVPTPTPRATQPPPCTHLLLSHDFAYTYAREPVRAPYAPPSHCPTPPSNTSKFKYSSIVLEWSATCQGRQFDRIFGVWLGGVEILRGCTAEPTRGGIFWKVRKDVTKYSELFLRGNGDLWLDVYLGNLIDKTYTGVYHVNITVFYYYPDGSFVQSGGSLGENGGDLGQISVNGEKGGSLDENGGNLGENGKNGGNLGEKSGNLDAIGKNGGKGRNLSEKGGNLGENGGTLGEKGGNLSNEGEISSPNGGNLGENGGNWADVILPISRDLPLKDGLWFEIENSTDVESKEVVIPRNTYRAVLEVYISYHENDEFWNTNLPNEYLIANNLTSYAQANGAFREVLVTLDGNLVGAICPFTVVFTGGINPLLWRPITGIGSFNLPSYDIEITPFLGKLLDGKNHRFGFSVTNALNVWYIDANLHLWLDEKSTVTQGGLLQQNANPVNFSSRFDFNGLDGNFFTSAKRAIVSTGWVKSSCGNITTTSTQKFRFQNYMILGKDGNLQIVNQTIQYNTSVSSANVLFPLHKVESHRKYTFPMFLYTDEFDLGNSSYTYQSNVTLGFNEDKTVIFGNKAWSSSLRNFQKAEGDMVVQNNLVSGGVGGTHQVYEYDENNGGFYYFRNVSSYNYTILHDEERETCKYYVSGLDGSAILLRE